LPSLFRRGGGSFNTYSTTYVFADKAATNGIRPSFGAAFFVPWKWILSGLFHAARAGKSRILLRHLAGKGLSMPNQNQVDDSTQVEPPVDSGAASHQNPPAGGSDVLTKEQADALIKARIDKQNAKHAKETDALAKQLAEEQATKAELEEKVATFEHEKELSEWKAQASKETGVPAEVLKGETLEEIQAHAAQIKEAMPMYPTLPNDTGAANPPAVTKEEIYQIKNREERVRAMDLHPELF